MYIIKISIKPIMTSQILNVFAYDAMQELMNSIENGLLKEPIKLNLNNSIVCIPRNNRLISNCKKHE